jgi:hypothetical protein
METPPWEDKGQTTKACKDVAENVDIFPIGVKEGIIKKRFEGVAEFMMKLQGASFIRAGCDVTLALKT